MKNLLLGGDRAKEYKVIAELQKELAEALNKANKQGEYYGKGLKIRMGLEEEIANKNEQLKAKDLKIHELEAKLFKPVPSSNQPTFKAKA